MHEFVSMCVHQCHVCFFLCQSQDSLQQKQTSDDPEGSCRDRSTHSKDSRAGLALVSNSLALSEVAAAGLQALMGWGSVTLSSVKMTQHWIHQEAPVICEPEEVDGQEWLWIIKCLRHRKYGHQTQKLPLISLGGLWEHLHYLESNALSWLKFKRISWGYNISEKP